MAELLYTAINFQIFVQFNLMPFPYMYSTALFIDT